MPAKEPKVAEKAQGPHTATNARGVHQKANGKVPILPLELKPEGPLRRFRSPHV